MSASLPDMPCGVGKPHENTIRPKRAGDRLLARQEGGASGFGQRGVAGGTLERQRIQGLAAELRGHPGELVVSSGLSRLVPGSKSKSNRTSFAARAFWPPSSGSWSYRAAPRGRGAKSSG